MVCSLRTFILLFTITLIFAQDPEDLLSIGESQLSSGDYSEAELSFNSALQADPSFAPALQALSKLHLHRGDLNKANEYSIQAVQADEDFREWSKQIIDIGDNMSRAKKPGTSSDVIALYESIIKDHPYYSDAYFYLGYHYYKNSDIKTASINFNKTLEIYPDHKNAKTMQGNINKKLLNDGNKSYKRGDLEGAKIKYLQALEYDPKFEKAYYQIGTLEKAAGRSGQAIIYLNKALELNPENHKTWLSLGAIYESDGNFEKAIELYRGAITVKYDYAKAYGNLGKLLYEVKQDFQEAERILIEVTQIDTGYANGFFHLGMVYKLQGIKKKNELDNSDAEDKNGYSSLQKLLSKAIENLSISIGIDSSNYENYNHLAELHIAVEDWDKAIEVSRKSVDIKKRPQSNGSGYYYWGMAELKKSKGRNKKRAKSLFEKAKLDRNWREAAEHEIHELNKEK